jgi:hypothetical protein
VNAESVQQDLDVGADLTVAQKEVSAKDSQPKIRSPVVAAKLSSEQSLAKFIHTLVSAMFHLTLDPKESEIHSVLPGRVATYSPGALARTYCPEKRQELEEAGLRMDRV